ncbi:MAG: hypothetical protein EXS37_12220 [Opitutus sp.]|nr:hypothetical protein [Opitutus sp.]
MSFEELQQSVARDAAPPAALGIAVQALWHDAAQQNAAGWERAHECAQADHSRAGSWVHAYLHRKEGDLANAGYWYARAGKTPPLKSVTLEAEWAEIARALVGG